jgi:hypothetical protein
MKKEKNNNTQTILLYNGIIALFFGFGFIHSYIVHHSVDNPQLSVLMIYLFFALFASFITTGIELFYKVIPDKIGYMFLIGTFIKLGFFTVLFLGKGLLDKQLFMAEKLAILIPLFLFLSLEVFVIMKRLKSI